LDILLELCHGNALILMVGNRSYLDNDKQVELQTVLNFTTLHFLDYLEISVFNDSNIEEAFTKHVSRISSRAITKDPISKSETNIMVSN
jgi:GTPase SAR1 family protein